MGCGSPQQSLGQRRRPGPGCRGWHHCSTMHFAFPSSRCLCSRGCSSPRSGLCGGFLFTPVPYPGTVLLSRRPPSSMAPSCRRQPPQEGRFDPLKRSTPSLKCSVKLCQALGGKEISPKDSNVPFLCFQKNPLHFQSLLVLWLLRSLFCFIKQNKIVVKIIYFEFISWSTSSHPFLWVFFHR